MLEALQVSEIRLIIIIISQDEFSVGLNNNDENPDEADNK